MYQCLHYVLGAAVKNVHMGCTENAPESVLVILFIFWSGGPTDFDCISLVGLPI